MAQLRILACQVAVPPMQRVAERDAHLARLEALVRAAVEREAVDLVVLPELAALDYARETFEALETLAEPLDGVSGRIWGKVARDLGVHVVYGFARQSETGPRIAMGVAGPEGCVGWYDKLHLAQYGASMEKEYFSAGEHVFVFEIKGFRVAPIICYDLRIPELSRSLVLDHGVEVILHSGAYARDESFGTWHDFAVTRAMENQVFLVSLNRAGAGYGQSLMCWPWMDEARPPLRFDAVAEECRVIEIDRAEMERARARYSFLKDRRQSYDRVGGRP